MQAKDRVLSARAAQAYYDRFGKKQDSQGFYEEPALDDLIANSDFQNCRQVFEFGCGTGILMRLSAVNMVERQDAHDRASSWQTVPDLRVHLTCINL